MLAINKMQKQQIYALDEIIDFLKTNNNFMILLLNNLENKTNFNIQKNKLYINLHDIKTYIEKIAKIKNAPFLIQLDKKITEKYFFDETNKILVVNHSFYEKIQELEYEKTQELEKKFEIKGELDPKAAKYLDKLYKKIK